MQFDQGVNHLYEYEYLHVPMYLLWITEFFVSGLASTEKTGKQLDTLPSMSKTDSPCEFPESDNFSVWQIVLIAGGVLLYELLLFGMWFLAKKDAVQVEVDPGCCECKCCVTIPIDILLFLMCPPVKIINYIGSKVDKRVTEYFRKQRRHEENTDILRSMQATGSSDYRD
ncbi:uncharacterized protein [Amphiura filiformis]|uniref:uncharacterized protein n=1 Tax=Amphiura filiformis TaxID=82378 RepID=UPI003B2206C3